MTKPLFDLAPPLSLPIANHDASFPVGRIFCVGRSAAHAAEMGNEADSARLPFYFTISPSPCQPRR